MTMEQYLQEVSKGLSGLPLQERQDILKEIENHIHEALSRGDALEEVLRRLGPPDILAQSYTQGHVLNKGRLRLRDVISGFAFYSTAALSAIIIVPTLGICAVAFLLSAVVVLVMGILGGIGLIAVPFTFGLMLLTGIPQLLMGIVGSVVMLLLAILMWWLLRAYIRSVSARYRKRRLG